MYFSFPADVEFESIPEPLGYHDTPRLSLNREGRLVMRKAFRSRVNEPFKFQGQVSKDGRYICLRPDENGNIRFSPEGVLTHKALSDMLDEKQVRFPVIYTMEWFPEQQVWIGCSEELPDPPENAIPQRKKKKGR